MFNSKKIATLEAEIKTLRSEKDSLAYTNSSLQSALDAATADYSAKEQDCENLRQILKHLLTFGETLTGSQASMSSMATTLNEKKSQALHAAEISCAGSEITNTIAENLKNLARNASVTSGEVEKLADQASQISSIVKLIHEIADQTNLLALNAAIEAARAGESGRGFAVVADEVRKLAERTSKATADIDVLVKTIAGNSVAAKDSMSELASQSEHFSVQGAAATANIDNVRSISKDIEGTMSQSALRGFVELAKIDHLVFKFKLYLSILGVAPVQGDISSHTGCRLGKWYYEGDGKKFFNTLSSYKELETPHMQVHESGKAAVTAMNNGDIPTVLKHLQAMENASTSVVRCLDRLLG